MRKTIMTLGITGVLTVGMLMASAQTAHAQFGFGNYGPSYGQSYSPSYGPSYGSSGYGYGSGPVYHQPSVHFDQVYHPTRLHWTPFRGLHTHGHYDTVPHYTPGHFDYQHGNHIHPNPAYHNH